jgi:phage-related protein
VTAEITQFVDPFGVVTTLDVDWQAKGRFMPEVLHEEDGVPGQPGARHRASRHKEHDFTIRITISAADEPGLRTAQRAMVSSMDPTRGEGTIRVTSPLADVREIPVYYVDGLQMDESPGASGPTMQQCDVTFRAYDPYWRDPSDVSGTFTIGAAPTFFPIFPIRLAASQIAASQPVLNGGDVDTWPVITLVGPGGAITLRNLTTGKSTVFSTVALGAGESIVIDTRPGVKTVTKNDGSNLFSDLDPTTALWSLQPGSNSVQLEMSGASVGASSLVFAYRQKYLSP